MGAEGAKILTIDHQVRAPAGSGHSAHAHDDNALRQIGSAELCKQKIAQLQLELQLLSPKNKPPDFEEVLEVDERQAGPDAVGAESAKVLAVDQYI